MKVLRNYASLIVIILSAIAMIVFLLAPAVSLTGKLSGEVTNFSGLQVSFGYTATQSMLVFNTSTKVLNASPLAIITLLLVVAGLVMAILSFKKKPKRVFIAVGVIVFAGAAVLMFLSVQGIVFVGSRDNLEMLNNFGLGAGAIIAAILNIISSGVMLIKML